MYKYQKCTSHCLSTNDTVPCQNIQPKFGVMDALSNSRIKNMDWEQNPNQEPRHKSHDTNMDSIYCQLVVNGETQEVCEEMRSQIKTTATQPTTSKNKSKRYILTCILIMLPILLLCSTNPLSCSPIANMKQLLSKHTTEHNCELSWDSLYHQGLRLQ